MANLYDAVKAYQASQVALLGAQKAADERVRKSRASVVAARAALAEAICQAAGEGMRQTEIIRITGYSRERVRQILRAGGIEPE